MAENIFASQGIFDDVRDEGGDKFQSLSGIDTTLEAPVKPTAKPKASPSFMDSLTKSPSKKTTRITADAASGATAGLAIGQQQTGETELASADSFIKILGGAGTGFLAGGPIGAVAGGLAAGLGAFLSTKSAKRASKAQKAKDVRYDKMVKEQIAREDKFRQEDKFARLEEQGYDRKRQKMNDKWALYNKFSDNFTSMINDDAELKKRFASTGF